LRCGKLAQAAFAAVGFAFEGTPADAEESEITNLNAPGDDVSGDSELVIENCGLIHVFLFSWIWTMFAAQTVE
jgi:hypothetical protein